jgi:hypothetical protein
MILLKTGHTNDCHTTLDTGALMTNALRSRMGKMPGVRLKKL